MAQITIRERDLTGNPAASTFDVAAVPGLTIKTQDELNRQGITYNTPIFVDSVSEFQGMFGDKPVQLTGAGIAYDFTEGVGITTPLPEQSGIADFSVSESNNLFEGGLAHNVILSNTTQVGELTDIITPITALDSIDADTFEQFDTITITPKQPKVGDTFSYDAQYSTVTATITAVSTPDVFNFTYNPVSSYDVGVGDPIPCFGVINFVVPEENTPEITFTYYDDPSGEDVTTTLSIIDLSQDLFGSGYGFPITVSDVTYSCAQAADGYFFGATATGNRCLDPGYIYACELLYAGIPIYYIPVAGATALGVYQAMEGQENVPSIFDQLRDRGTYNVKYLTSGGYPTFEYDNNKIVHIMLEVAGASNDQTDDYEDFDTDHLKITNGRGDCLALIDHFELDERNLLGAGSIWSRINKNYPTDPAHPDSGKDEDICGLKGRKYLSYGAMYTPYAQYDLKKTYVVDDKEIIAEYLPASFAYMICLAKQLNGSLPSYEATAGVGRGTVANIHFNSKTNRYNLCTKEVLTNYIANFFNSPLKADRKDTISINALTQINPYGIVIWGDRTLMQKDKVLGIKATGIVNIRNMVSDIKKQMYQVARRYMFSANNDALWINFRNGVIGLLNQMQSGYGIESYTLSKDTEKSTKAALYVLCSIKPIYPVEKFDITIEITDDDVEVAETINE